MSKIMKKFWLRPYWRADELDRWLSAQEAAGWRLEGSKPFWRLVFRAAEPKESAWFMTFQNLRAHGMYTEGSWLKKHCSADEIKLGIPFPCFFAWADAYRSLVPIEEDSLRELRLARNLFLRRMAWGSGLFWLLFLTAFSALVIASVATHDFRFTLTYLFAILMTALCLFMTGYHITGLCALRRRRRAYDGT